jgi:hypothetical protein
MKKHCIRLVERLRDNCPSTVIRTAGRNHDRFLVDSMVSFNFGGGWRELLLKVSPKHMTAKATTNERFAV